MSERIPLFKISPLTRRRLTNFKSNRRGFWSLWIFLALFTITLFAEFIANDKPLLLRYEGKFYFPVFVEYSETLFGGFLPTEADYRDPEVASLIREKGWMVWPPVPYSYDTINYNLAVPAPAPPSADNWLGTDDQGRDVVARLIYGFRISVLFGLVLTLLSSLAGIIAGAKGQGSGVRLGTGQFDCDVALAGRVYCNVDATEAGVEPGDLLTTSTKPGYAMKATDHVLAQGAILGKAMERLGKGERGQILVLVSLQ